MNLASILRWSWDAAPHSQILVRRVRKLSLAIFAHVSHVTGGQELLRTLGPKSIFLAALVLATVACEREAKRVAGPGTPEERVQSPANPAASTPVGQRFPVLNDDAKFEELVKDNRERMSFKAGYSMDKGFAQKYSPSFSNEVSQHARFLAEKQARIEQQLAKYNDPQLRATAKAKIESAEKNMPDPFPSKRQQQEAIAAFERVKDDFVRTHGNDFFVLGTYDDFIIDGELAVINLDKVQTVIWQHDSVPKEYVIALNKIGKQIDLSYSKRERIYEATKLADGYPEDCIDLWKAYQLFRRMEQDGRNSYGEEEVSEMRKELSKGILVPISMEEMNQAFGAVSSTWKAKYDELYNVEFQKGGFMSGSFGKQFYHSYSDPTYNEILKKGVMSIVRKQAILLVGKGDPFDLKLTECGLMVSGTNQYVKKLF